MGRTISYINCVIHIQSFELMPSSGWIPRFTLTCSDNSLLCRDRLDKVFLSQDEADEFALTDAMDWIDNHSRAVEGTPAS